MKIDGRIISSEILLKLSKRVSKLKKKGITPTMAIILMGDNEASKIYVRQKGIKAQEIGAKVKVYPVTNQTSSNDLEELVKKLDKNSRVHGVIIQRPAAPNIDANALTELISGVKEIDGFGNHSKYPVPVAKASLILIENAFEQINSKSTFLNWLKKQKIVIIGKGETAGHPILEFLNKRGLRPYVIDSKTPSKEKLLKEADIIITAVGKTILSSKQIKKGVILVGVGLYSDQKGKLKGDYDNLDVENVASFYSPTPGGVGPVNVACLLENLVKAAENSSK
ncbi:MAG: bifunctional 5,10-methylenetetrahydrofolate dehydrogenase/5,10-methenyltetrahydrofolate cyclohydrolase [Candidatus Levybacteria bacterium]|nr:bifunctional 5,10-methylenetetrahydrofolate dehydrogenase/5,10-methenyltetrahydrofolate cyclohydrolase [Candidatus Levybacteria bacterium]